MKETVYRDEDMKCPICDQPVKKVMESDKEINSPIKCENEYGLHYGNFYIKFIHPKTSPDHIRWEKY